MRQKLRTAVGLVEGTRMLSENKKGQFISIDTNAVMKGTYSYRASLYSQVKCEKWQIESGVLIQLHR